MQVWARLGMKAARYTATKPDRKLGWDEVQQSAGKTAAWSVMGHEGVGMHESRVYAECAKKSTGIVRGETCLMLYRGGRVPLQLQLVTRGSELLARSMQCKLVVRDSYAQSSHVNDNNTCDAIVFRPTMLKGDACQTSDTGVQQGAWSQDNLSLCPLCTSFR